MPFRNMKLVTMVNFGFVAALVLLIVIGFTACNARHTASDGNGADRKIAKVNKLSGQRALIVIDVQGEYFQGRLAVSYPKGSLDNILAAMDAATEQGVAVVVVRHTSTPGGKFFQVGTPAWNLLPQIAKRPHDLLVDKKLPGCFTGTGLEEWLRKRNINEVTIAGYMTQMCCDTTSRQAVHRGFKVQFLSDATGTLNIKNKAGSVSAEELHKAILVTQAMRFAKVVTTAQWIQGLSSTK